jgi:hypothetical protein
VTLIWENIFLYLLDHVVWYPIIPHWEVLHRFSVVGVIKHATQSGTIPHLNHLIVLVNLNFHCNTPPLLCFLHAQCQFPQLQQFSGLSWTLCINVATFCTRAVQSNPWHNFRYIIILCYISNHILINLIDMKLVPMLNFWTTRQFLPSFVSNT